MNGWTIAIIALIVANALLGGFVAGFAVARPDWWRGHR